MDRAVLPVRLAIAERELRLFLQAEPEPGRAVSSAGCAAPNLSDTNLILSVLIVIPLCIYQAIRRNTASGAVATTGASRDLANLVLYDPHYAKVAPPTRKSATMAKAVVNSC